jgi:hypothetical protein
MLPAMKPPQTPERMRKLLAQRARHGLTWPELSRRSGLPVWKLHSWRRRLAGQKPPRRKAGTFAPAQIVDRGPRQAPPELVHVCRERFIVPAGESPAPAKVVPAG